MATIMNFSLTQYTDLRSLQFEYTKLKDENGQLKMKVNQIQKMYEKLSLDFSSYKKQQNRKFSQLQSKLSQRQNQLMQCENSLKQIWIKISEISKSDEIFSEDTNIHDMISIMEIQLKSLIDNENHTKEVIRSINCENERKQKQWTFRQQNLAEKIVELQDGLKNLQDMRLQLHAENMMLLKDNEQLVMQVASYKMLAEQARNKSPIKQKIEQGESVKDENFAVDLLTYEREYLSRVFLNVVEGLRNEDLRECCKRIYETYEQKLQLEYDLQDLEYQYKKQRNSQQENVLMELRKEIETFRRELNSQKQLLHDLQEKVQEQFKDLQSQQFHEEKLRNMTMDMQYKLRKSNQVRQQNSNMNSRVIELKQTTNTDELVKDMIEKDRQNLERILQQTRSLYKK